MGPLPEAEADQDDDQRQSRQQRRVAVERRPVLVPTVAAQAADRLAPPADREDDAEAAEQREREQPLMQVPTEPERNEARDAERQREDRHEPGRIAPTHRGGRRPRPSRRNIAPARWHVRRFE